MLKFTASTRTLPSIVIDPPPFLTQHEGNKCCIGSMYPGNWVTDKYFTLVVPLKKLFARSLSAIKMRKESKESIAVLYLFSGCNNENGKREKIYHAYNCIDNLLSPLLRKSQFFLSIYIVPLTLLSYLMLLLYSFLAQRCDCLKSPRFHSTYANSTIKYKTIKSVRKSFPPFVRKEWESWNNQWIPMVWKYHI